MRIEHAELIWVKLPLVHPFRTSFGTSYDRQTFLLRVITDAGAEGWSECAAEPDPLYSSEFLDGAELVLREHLIPRLVVLGDDLTAALVGHALAPVKGHFMAKHVLETALLDAPDITMLTITHNLNPELLRRYDNVLFMEDGRITQAGSYDALFAAGGGFAEFANMKYNGEA